MFLRRIRKEKKITSKVFPHVAIGVGAESPPQCATIQLNAVAVVAAAMLLLNGTETIRILSSFCFLYSKKYLFRAAEIVHGNCSS